MTETVLPMPAIRYSCPRCSSVIEAQPEAVGTKMHCPTCGQRLQIPGTPINKTVLAKEIPESNAVAIPVPSLQTWPAQAEPPPVQPPVAQFAPDIDDLPEAKAVRR